MVQPAEDRDEDDRATALGGWWHGPWLRHALL